MPTSPAQPCIGILLAAGSSRRFGGDKRLHPLPGSRAPGEPLAVTTMRAWAAAISTDGLSELIVVTRGAASTAAAAQDPLDAPLFAAFEDIGIAARVINAPDAELGMGHSLAAAVACLTDQSIVVGLADMPWVEPDTIKQVAHKLRRAAASAIVRPSYNGTPGNPIGFGADRLSELAQSTGDEGARAVVKEAAAHDQVLDLPVTDNGILRDVDTLSDLGSDTGRMGI